MITIEFKKLREHSVTLIISDGNFNTKYSCSDQLAIGKVLEHAVDHFHMARAKEETARFFKGGWE